MYVCAHAQAAPTFFAIPPLTYALYICEKKKHFEKPMKTYWNKDLNIGKEGI